MAEAPISKKRKRGNPNQKTGLIGVSKHGKKYKAQIWYGGAQHNLGSFNTKEQAGMAYDRVAIDKSTEEVTYVLNYPNITKWERVIFPKTFKSSVQVYEVRNVTNVFFCFTWVFVYHM